MRLAARPSKVLASHTSCAYCAARHLCLPEGLDAPGQHALDGIVEGALTLPKGSTVCDSTQPMHYLYAVRTGTFKEYAIHRGGQEQIIDFYFPGDLIGLDALGQRNYYYPTLALENSEACRISLEKLSPLMEHHPSLQRRLLRLVSQQSLNRTFLNATQSAEQKLALFLISLSQRVRERGLSATQLALSFTRYDIAHYLQLTTETVSRTLTRFRQRGLIATHKRRIEIRQPLALAQLAN